MAKRNVEIEKLQIRQDTAANWESKNPVLAAGEFGYDATNKVVKIGDGTTAWKDLAAIGGGAAIALYAAFTDEAEKARGYTRGGEIDNKFKSFEARLKALEGSN